MISGKHSELNNPDKLYGLSSAVKLFNTLQATSFNNNSEKHVRVGFIDVQLVQGLAASLLLYVRGEIKMCA